MIEREPRTSTEAVLLRLHDAMNQRDAEACAACYTDDASLAQPESGVLRGREAIAQDFRILFRAFPDLTFAHKHRLAEDNMAAVEYTLSGTHRGPLDTSSGPLEPTGREMTLGCASFVTAGDEGRIVDERRYYDLVGFLAQLGVAS
jgi:uncharacterized protein (TIGR02246 family)